MTLVTELRLIRVAPDALVLKTHFIGLAVACHIHSHVVPDYLGPPLVEQLHMPGDHFFLRQHALLVDHLADDRGIELELRRRSSLAVIEPNREGHQNDEYDQADKDIFSIIYLHSQYPPFQAEARCE